MTLDEYLADLAAKAAAGNPEKFTLVKVSELAALVAVAEAVRDEREARTSDRASEANSRAMAALDRLTALARTR